MDCDRIVLGRERQTEVSEWLLLQWLVIWDLFYTPIELRPVLPTACESDLFVVVVFPSSFSLSFTVVSCLFLFSFPILVIWINQMLYCIFAGCMLIMYNSDVCMRASGAVNTLCFVWKFSCIKFHSLIHAYKYINDACNFIFSSLAMTSC